MCQLACQVCQCGLLTVHQGSIMHACAPALGITLHLVVNTATGFCYSGLPHKYHPSLSLSHLSCVIGRAVSCVIRLYHERELLPRLRGTNQSTRMTSSYGHDALGFNVQACSNVFRPSSPLCCEWVGACRLKCLCATLLQNLKSLAAPGPSTPGAKGNALLSGGLRTDNEWKKEVRTHSKASSCCQVNAMNSEHQPSAHHVLLPPDTCSNMLHHRPACVSNQSNKRGIDSSTLHDRRHGCGYGMWIARMICARLPLTVAVNYSQTFTLISLTAG